MKTGNLEEPTQDDLNTETIKEKEEKKEEFFQKLPFGIAEIEENNFDEEKKEDSFNEIIVEKDPIYIEIDRETLLETASEIRFKTLFLDRFPIKYKNFSKTLEPTKITKLGITEVDFGFEKMNIAQVKLLEYPKFKMIEFKKRDFRIAFGVNDEGTILLHSNGLFEYEINRDIKNNRLRYILEFFIKLFAGTSIKFHLANVVCDLDFVNHIEEFKFKNILEVLEKYEDLVKVYGLQRNKDLTNINNSFYELSLLDIELNSKNINTWINLKMENNPDLKEGDRIILNRLHKLNFKNLSFNLLEEIEVKNPLTEKELLNGKINLSKKTVKINLKRIKK